MNNIERINLANCIDKMKRYANDDKRRLNAIELGSQPVSGTEVFDLNARIASYADAIARQEAKLNQLRQMA